MAKQPNEEKIFIGNLPNGKTINMGYALPKEEYNYSNFQSGGAKNRRIPEDNFKYISGNIYRVVLEEKEMEDDMSTEILEELKKINDKLGSIDSKVSAIDLRVTAIEENQITAANFGTTFSTALSLPAFELETTKILNNFVSGINFSNAISVSTTNSINQLNIPNRDAVDKIVNEKITPLPTVPVVENIVNNSKKHFLTFYAGAIAIIVSSILGSTYMFTGRIDSKIESYTKTIEGKVETINNKYVDVVNKQSAQETEIKILKAK